MMNTIFQWVFFVGFIWLLIDMTRTNSKSKKAQQRLYEIERLTKIAANTEDEKIKASMKDKIFKMLEKKL